MDITKMMSETPPVIAIFTSLSFHLTNITTNNSTETKFTITPILSDQSLSLNLTNNTITNNITETEFTITPIVSNQMTKIIVYIKAFYLNILAGALGIFANTANISVYLKMGLQETTNINFFALSVFDLLISLGAVVIQVTYYSPVYMMRLPSGASVRELGMGACLLVYPCLGCTAWITAFLSVERCLCISLPLKVKDIVTPRRMIILILVMVFYQSVFIVLLFVYPGPPYDILSKRRSLYFIFSLSVPSLICFFVVSVSTVILVVCLKQNLEWRNAATATKQSAQSGQSGQSCQNSGVSKERKAARSVVAICTIFIVCFAPNVALFLMSVVYPKFTTYDPYLGNLKRILLAISGVMQVMNSSVNILVYYRMSSRYREVFNSLFCRRWGEKG
ncbi:hypothetical protein EGW08_023487 [Elysia chlorotica]|uniref:G-protein coupled receptors family 1 profile domain-containing protein n=1 Tax=Elysia chlorotica TaxID=188477 RepID=A0A3S1BJJ9_ELYCH|nr:hypothetical protein EGW08_023487 [Elysia chlorotica]